MNITFDPALLNSLSGLNFKARYVMEGFLSGMHQSPFHGFSVEFSDYRNYQPGDDLRHLDWRLYARSDRLCIKRFEQETNVRFYLLLDSSASMSYRGEGAWASKFECAQVVATALSWLMLRQNDAVGLLALEPDAKTHELRPHYISPSQKPSQLGMMLRHLQQLQPMGGERLKELLTKATQLFHRRSVIILFSDLLESPAETERLFKQLKFLGHECIIFQVLDRDEIEFPFTRPQLFLDLETGARRQVRPETARQRYLERFQAFMEAEKKRFVDLEMDLFLLRTDSDPVSALRGFFGKRKKYQ
jgi:uncharacterized protein (DUF58 family)